MTKFRLGLVRDFESGEFFEKFFVSAVFSILALRAYLGIFGYPKIGEGQFHVAHILWGGFLMMFALILLLAFLNREIKSFAAIVGGLGFGMFVDELGKFITSDNNYFFQPSIALIYVVFILLFLFLRGIEKYFRLSRREYAVNAFEMTKEAIAKDLEEEEKKKALMFLARSDQKEPAVELLRDILMEIPVVSQKPTFVNSFVHKTRRFFHKVINFPYFAQSVVFVFVAVAVFSLLRSLFLLGNTSGFAQWGELASSVLVGTFTVVGVYFLRKNRLQAYELFKISILISIFLTQFFEFLTEQLAATLGLVVGIFILTVIEYLIREEKLTVRS